MQTRGANDFRDAGDSDEHRAEPSNGESSNSRALRDLMGKADPTLALRTSQKPDDHFDLPTKKNVEKGADRMSALDPFYPFGPLLEVEIPIECIIEPPATMCYRKMNIQHVENIMQEMVDNPTQICHTAELVPWNPETKKLVCLLKSGTNLSQFLEVAIELKFFAVSGQH